MPIFIVAVRCVGSGRYIGWGYGQPQHFTTLEGAQKAAEWLRIAEEAKGELRRFDEVIVVQI